jgi:hypothetical protein
MRRRRARVSVLLSVLLLVLVVPTASAKVERTAYSAFQFPAGWPGSGTTCPGTYITTPFAACVIEPQGTVVRPDHGRWTIRDMVSLMIVFSTSDPAISGYQITTLNANLDASGNGPAWGTFDAFTLADEPTFSGVYNGKFGDTPDGVRLGAHSVGLGLGTYAGLHFTSDFLMQDTALGNVIGEIKQTGP